MYLLILIFCILNHIITVFDETSDSNLNSYTWNIESINITKKDKYFYENFENNICFDGEIYYVKLPFT